MARRHTSSGRPSKDKFAQRMMDAFREAGETSPIRYDAEQYLLIREADPKNEMNLGNAYKEYCAAPRDQRKVVFQNFVRAWFSYRREIPSDFEDVSHDLLLGIRSRGYYEVAILTMRTDKQEDFHWPYRVLAHSLGAGLVYDLRESMVQILQHSLDTWNVTFDEAFDIACENLRQISQEGLDEVESGVWQSPWRDNYDASRMLLTDFLRAHTVKGDPVVMVPNRDTLLLTGSRNAAALEKLAAMAEEAYDHPRPISGMAFRLGADDEWVPFLPSVGQPHYEKLKLLQVKSLGSDFRDQAEALNALHEKTGQDIFVASFSAYSSQDTGEVRSYCVWSEGVTAYLPRTDDIFFFRPRGKEDGDIVASVPWERAQAVLGEKLKPVGLYPERYLVEDFPSEEELARLQPDGQG